MSRKHVLIPWDRYQVLLALEQKVVKTSKPLIEESDDKTATAPETAKAITPTESCAFAIGHCYSTDSNRESIKEGNVQLPAPLQQEEEDSSERGKNSPDFQHRSGEENKTSLKKEELALLRPPGIPARDTRRWLVWE